MGQLVTAGARRRREEFRVDGAPHVLRVERLLRVLAVRGALRTSGRAIRAVARRMRLIAANRAADVRCAKRVHSRRALVLLVALVATNVTEVIGFQRAVDARELVHLLLLVLGHFHVLGIEEGLDHLARLINTGRRHEKGEKRAPHDTRARTLSTAAWVSP